MHRTLLAAASAFALTGAAAAQTTTPVAPSALPAATAAGPTDIVPVSQACTGTTTGYCSRKITIQQIGDVIGSAAPATASPQFTGAAGFTSGVDNTTYKDVTSAATALVASSGNGVIFCPQLSCRPRGFTGHQRASLLVSSPTLFDGEFEEQTLAVVTDIATGYSTPWVASHAYNVGDNVISDNSVFRATNAATSGSTAPLRTAAPGTTSDGGVTWQWISTAPIDSKVGFYNEARVMPGAGQGWAQANNIAFLSGWLGSFGAGLENDVSNSSGDAPVGGPKLIVNTWVNTNTTDPITVNLEVSGKAHWGIWEDGALDIGLKLTDSAPIAIDAGTGTRSTATVLLADTSPSGVDVAGHHTVALDTSQDSAVTALNLAPGQQVCFSGLHWCAKYQSSTNRLTFLNGSDQPVFSIGSDGTLRAAGPVLASTAP